MTGATSTRRLRVQPLAMLPLLRSASLRTGFAAGVVDDVKLPWAVRVGVREGGEGGGGRWRGRGRREGVDCAGGVVIGGPDGAGEDLGGVGEGAGGGIVEREGDVFEQGASAAAKIGRAHV